MKRLFLQLPRVLAATVGCGQPPIMPNWCARWSENDRQVYLWSLATVAGWDLDHRLDAISCPTCLVSGEYDFFPLALKKAYVGRMPDARRVVIRGSGHFTPIDEPERFNKAVMTFLSSQR